MDMSYLKDMPIAVLGGGAVGKTMAADCALAGKEVRIWDQPEFAKRNFVNIEKTGITMSGNQFSFFGYQRKGIAKVALATDDLAKAVKGARHHHRCHRRSGPRGDLPRAGPAARGRPGHPHPAG